MPEQILKNVGIWIDGRNLAGVSNAVGITLEVEAPESTSPSPTNGGPAPRAG